jgi:hypothetical protein
VPYSPMPSPVAATDDRPPRAKSFSRGYAPIHIHFRRGRGGGGVDCGSASGLQPDSDVAPCVLCGKSAREGHAMNLRTQTRLPGFMEEDRTRTVVRLSA